MLSALEGYAAATLTSLTAAQLGTVSDGLTSLEQTVLANAQLRGVLTDTSLTGVARGAVVREILTGKSDPAVVKMVAYAATHAPAQDVPHAIAELSYMALSYRENAVMQHEPKSLLEARRRVAGFADAILEATATDQFGQIEDDLFRWARIVESTTELRRLLLDRDAPLAARLGATDQLIEGKVSPLSLTLARFAIVGGRPRDLVGTLDYLVDYVARARNWRVARVRAAQALDEASRRQLAESLTTLTGHQVELQVVQDTELLGGVLVEVGDLRLDATTRGRLAALRDSVVTGRAADILHSID
jgi:F-type H+-transporting ATPase subunit delta